MCLQRAGHVGINLLLHCVSQTASQTPQAAANTKNMTSPESGSHTRNPIMSPM